MAIAFVDKLYAHFLELSSELLFELLIELSLGCEFCLELSLLLLLPLLFQEVNDATHNYHSDLKKE